MNKNEKRANCQTKKLQAPRDAPRDRAIRVRFADWRCYATHGQPRQLGNTISCVTHAIRQIAQMARSVAVYFSFIIILIEAVLLSHNW